MVFLENKFLLTARSEALKEHPLFNPRRINNFRACPPERWLSTLALLLIAFAAIAGHAQPSGKKSPVDAKKNTDSDAKPSKPEKAAYDFVLPGPDGKDVPLSSFKGKFLLIVNLARNSGYNEQLAALIKLSETYKSKDLVVIGVPSNDFGAAEPGTPAEVQKAYTDAKVTFPVMALSKVTGDDELPFYNFLTKGKSALPGGPVHWNYTKFFLDKKGKPIARLSPDVTPDSPEMLATIDQILDGRYKPKKAGGGKPPADADDDD